MCQRLDCTRRCGGRKRQAGQGAWKRSPLHGGTCAWPGSSTRRSVMLRARDMTSRGEMNRPCRGERGIMAQAHDTDTPRYMSRASYAFSVPLPRKPSPASAPFPEGVANVAIAGRSEQYKRLFSRAAPPCSFETLPWRVRTVGFAYGVATDRALDWCWPRTPASIRTNLRGTVTVGPPGQEA